MKDAEMTDTPTLAEMIQQQDEMAAGYDDGMGADAESDRHCAHDARIARATAALLRKLSEPSDDMLERMASEYHITRARLYKDWDIANAGRDDGVGVTDAEFNAQVCASMRAALSELLTGEATNDDA